MLIANRMNHFNIISFSFWLYFRSCITHSCGHTIWMQCTIHRQSKWSWIEVIAVNNHQMSPFKKEVFQWNQIVSIGISFLKLIAFPFVWHHHFISKMVNWTQNTVDPDKGDGFSSVKRFAFITFRKIENKFRFNGFSFKVHIIRKNHFRCGIQHNIWGAAIYIV